MRVIDVARVEVRATARRPRALNIELVGLAAASIVVLFGIALVSAAKVARLKEVAAPETVIPLYALGSPADLDPVLTMFTSPEERQAAALALYRRATSAHGPLDHVGALAEVTIPAAAVRADRRLTVLGVRLDRRPDAREVPVLSRADIVSMKPRLAVRTVGQFNRGVARAVAAFTAAFWIAHVFRRWRRRDDDPVVLPALMLLCGIGVMTMIALRDPVRDTLSAAVFAGGAALSIAVLVLASEIEFEASRLRRAVVLPLTIAVALATLLLVFGSGPGTSGVRVNLFGAQPVEVIRLLVVFALAAYFGRRIELVRELSEPATPSRPWLRHVRLPRWKDVRPVLASMALVLIFFFLQKDFGPALVLSCVFLGLYGLARARTGLVALGFTLLLAGFAAAYWTGVPAVVRDRVMIWADPWNNGVPGGNQVAHGLWALSTGGAWGSGAGLGSPNAIPEGHTDFVLAAIGEELGFVGLAAVIVLYAFLCWRCLRIALRAPGDFSTFLAVGVVLVLNVQALVIGAGLLGLVPLSGVVTPFLSYGRSSMLANGFAIGLVLSIGRRQSAVREHMRRPIRVIAAVLSVAAAIVLSRIAWVQVVHADDMASAPSLTEQADGGYRFEYNPRLLSAARTLVRGTIYDRNRLPLATSRPEEIAAASAAYEAAGGVAPEDCAGVSARCYPLGGLAFHVVGDWVHQANWAARNASYLERDSDARLKGFDDGARLVEVVNPRTGRREQAIRRDFRELLPLVRQRYRTGSEQVRAIRARDRDVQTSLDARLQVRVAAALRDGIASGGFARGAAVVLDAATGEVLAAASYPWPEAGDLERAGLGPVDRDTAPRWLDRARYGLYPPGSTFKLVIAGAAIRSHHDADRFMCTRLPDGRVGAYVPGMSRPVRDDPMDTVPHGDVDLERGLIVSCNAYFAQLALALGPRPVLDAAALFQIDVARTPTPDGLRPALGQVGYGQGEALVSPLKLARVSGSIASDGSIAPVRWEPAEASAEGCPRFLSAQDANRVARAMRSVVTSGTGRALRSHSVAIAGKTGTAEVAGAPAHSWFTGFAPYRGTGRRIAFAVIVENAGYGSRAAAPIAGQIVSAAKELGLIK
ncbi:MAG TPA: FtsW/RodA/SpoVE family cell cycle protein [Vicinamibacterales bacterium]|jgi:cell division protein FtsW (lipid II flippase)/cell division protein FtsI/penicillin-binding protein 2|nr:FtsW/RodA/SpoVE family cell cycle protein [Vicinamibacterales bacterium]